MKWVVKAAQSSLPEIVDADKFNSKLESNFKQDGFVLIPFTYNLITKYSKESSDEFIYKFEWSHHFHTPKLGRYVKCWNLHYTENPVYQFDGNSAVGTMVCEGAKFKGAERTQEVHINHGYAQSVFPPWAYDDLTRAIRAEPQSFVYLQDAEGFNCDEIEQLKLETFEFEFETHSTKYQLTRANYFMKSAFNKGICFLTVSRGVKADEWTLGGQFIRTYLTALWESNENEISLSIIMD